MNKAEILEILQSLDMRPDKNFGQNFMIDKNLLDFIVRTVAPAKGDLILEVGPGLGALTRRLVASDARIISVEIDKRLSEYLETNIKAPNFHLVRGDVCRIDIPSVLAQFGGHGEKPARWRCVANLPYSITTPFIAEMLQMENPPADMLFMLQRETAERFDAGIDSKAYGSITVLLQCVYEMELVRKVHRNVFFPVPDVDSAIMHFKLKEQQRLGPSKLADLESFLRLAFSQRRKKMNRTLEARYAASDIEKAYAELKLDPNSRPGQVTQEQFVRLLEMLSGSAD